MARVGTPAGRLKRLLNERTSVNQVLRENLWCPTVYVPTLFSEGRVKLDGAALRDANVRIGPDNVLSIDDRTVPWPRPVPDRSTPPFLALHNKIAQDQSVKYSGSGHTTVHTRLQIAFPDVATRLVPVNPLIKRWSGLMMLCDHPLFAAYLNARLPAYYVLRTTMPLTPKVEQLLQATPGDGKLPLCELVGEPKQTDGQRPMFSQTILLSDSYSQRRITDLLMANGMTVHACYCMRLGGYSLQHYVQNYHLTWGESVALSWNAALQQHWDAFITKLEGASSVRLSTGGRLVLDNQYDTPAPPSSSPSLDP